MTTKKSQGSGNTSQDPKAKDNTSPDANTGDNTSPPQKGGSTATGSVDRAEHLLQTLGQEKAQAAKKELQQLDKGYQHFIRCDSCNRPAIFCTSTPIGKVLGPDDWFSNYKALGHPWSMSQVPCQACLAPILEDGGDVIEATRFVPLLAHRPTMRDGQTSWLFELKGASTRLAMRMPLDPKVRAKRPVERSREGDVEQGLGPVVYGEEVTHVG